MSDILITNFFFENITNTQYRKESRNKKSVRQVISVKVYGTINLENLYDIRKTFLKYT